MDRDSDLVSGCVAGQDGAAIGQNGSGRLYIVGEDAEDNRRSCIRAFIKLRDSTQSSLGRLGTAIGGVDGNGKTSRLGSSP